MTLQITSETLGKSRRTRPRPAETEAASVVVLGGSVWGVRVIHSLNELRPLARQMDRVHAESAQRSPFTTFAFIESYARHDEYFAEPGSLDLCVVCAFAGNTLMGYLPMKRVRERVGPLAQTKLEFLCTHDSELPHVVAGAADEARVSTALVEYLLEHDASFAMLELKEQPAGSPLLASVMPAAVHGFYDRRFPSADVATINLRWPSLAAYYGDFSKKQRSNVARQVRRLLALENVELITSRHPASLAAAFELYLDLEQRSWKARANGVIGRHPKRVAFFRDLIGKADPFELSFDILCAGGEPVAGIVNGRYGAKLFALQIAYDEAFRDSGPGVLMLLWSMKRAIEERLSAYHLLHGSSYYKTRWLADVVSTQSMQFFRFGTPAYVKARLGDAKRWLRKPAAAKALAYNLEKRAVLAKSRVRVSGAMRDVSRALVERCRASSGVAIHDRDAIANAMPFQV